MMAPRRIIEVTERRLEVDPSEMLHAGSTCDPILRGPLELSAGWLAFGVQGQGRA